MQLLFPGFLWGLLGIGIPVLIHLLQLRRQQRVKFTNTAFVQEVEQKKGNSRLQDRLVLLLRALAVTFLVLMFCQPIIPSRLKNAVGEREVAVVIDTSPLMQVRAGNQESQLEHAIATAEMLGSSRASDMRFRLVGSRKAGKMTAKDYATAVTALPNEHQLIGWKTPTVQREWQGQQETSGTLYVFSAFQKSALGPTLLKEVSAKREVVLVPQTVADLGNLFVDSLWLNDAFVRVRANAGLHIRLRNGGSALVANCPVKVMLGGHQVAAYNATVKAGQTTETAVQLQMPDGRLVTGQVVLGDAPVTFDNTHYFALQPTTAIRVVEIGQEPMTRAAYQNEPLFQYNFFQAQRVNFGAVKQANMVLLSEPTVLDTGLRDALVAVVQRGGSVVVVPPANQRAHESYTQLLRALGIGGVQWDGTVASKPVKQEVAMPNLRSPFFREVFGSQPRQLVLPEVSPVLNLGSNGTDILRLRDGESFLTEFTVGSGRAYIFSAPFAKQYSDFTSHSLFVPVLYRLAMLSYRTDQPLAYRIGQSSLTLAVPPSPAGVVADESSYRLVRDSLALVPAQRLQGQQLQLELPAELTTPGFYKLTRQGREVATLAFNLARGESQLATYSATELRQLLGSARPNVHVLDGGAQPQVLREYRTEQTGQPLWRYCLGLALACLLAEELLLRRARQPRPLVVASR